MNHFVKVAAFFCCLSVFTNYSNAGVVVDISKAVAGSSQGYKNGTNHIIGNKNGYFGANLFTDDRENTTLSVEFLGSQAKWDVWFTLTNGSDTTTIINHPNGASGIVKANNTNRQQSTISVGSQQLINFSFYIDVLWNGIGADYVVSNGSNTLPTSLQANNPGRYFWTGFEYSNNGSISAILLGLDDGGGWPTTDEDNDDLMIRMTGFNAVSLFNPGPISPPSHVVPVPASIWLMLSSLSIIGAIKRRR